MGEGFAEPGRPTLMGDLLSLLAAVLWGATTVLIRATALKSAAPEKTLLYQLRSPACCCRRSRSWWASRASST